MMLVDWCCFQVLLDKLHNKNNTEFECVVGSNQLLQGVHLVHEILIYLKLHVKTHCFSSFGAKFTANIFHATFWEYMNFMHA